MKNLLLIGVLGLVWAFGVGRSEEPSDGTGGAPSSTDEINAAFERAEAQTAEGQYAAAAQSYQELLTELPVCARAQQAAFKAAACFEHLQQPAEAIKMYDRVVALGHEVLKPQYYKNDGQKRKAISGKPASVRDRMQRALKRHAILCSETRDPVKGLRAIRHLEAIAPTSALVVDLIPLRLEFESRAASEAQILIRRQQEAADLCHEAQAALSTEGREAAVLLLDRVLSDYPDTAAATRARADKAEILWVSKRYDESRELYQEIINQIGQIAPDANAVRDAKYRIAWFEFVHRIKTAERQTRWGGTISDAQWQEVRDACQIIMELDPDPLHRADAHTELVSTYCWQGRYQDVLASATDFFRNYCGSRSAQGRLFAQMAWIRLYKGIAFENLGRWSEAANEYHAVLQLEIDHPGVLATDRAGRAREQAWDGLNRLTGE